MDALSTDPTGGYDVTQQIGHLLRKAYQHHLAIFHEALMQFQLTSAQFVILCILHDHGASSQIELVQATAVDQATIRGIVKRLNARGLITLKRDGQDARKIVISLTGSGAQLLEHAIPHATRVSAATVAGLNAAEKVALDYLLRKVVV